MVKRVTHNLYLKKSLQPSFGCRTSLSSDSILKKAAEFRPHSPLYFPCTLSNGRRKFRQLSISFIKIFKFKSHVRTVYRGLYQAVDFEVIV